MKQAAPVDFDSFRAVRYCTKHRGCGCIRYVRGCPGVLAGSRPNQPRLSSPGSVSQLLYVADANGRWQRSRSITLAIYMRDRKQIARFGQSVNSKLSELRQILPADLILAHTSDQPLQVYENIHLFMRALVKPSFSSSSFR